MLFRSCYNNYFGKQNMPIQKEKKVENKIKTECEGDVAISKMNERIALEMAKDKADNSSASPINAGIYHASAKLLSYNLEPGRMMKVKLIEDYSNENTQLALHAGTILYGQIEIDSGRVKCNFRIAENQSKKIFINLNMFDSDNSLGIDRNKLISTKQLIIK